MTKHGAKRLLRDAYPIHSHIDLWVSIYAYVHDFRIIACSDISLKQNQKVKTDIQNENGCDICNVPANYSKSHKLVSYSEWRMLKTTQIIAAGFFVFIAYQQYKRYAAS
jgi:hypothetical protein